MSHSLGNKPTIRVSVRMRVVDEGFSVVGRVYELPAGRKVPLLYDTSGCAFHLIAASKEVF